MTGGVDTRVVDVKPYGGFYAFPIAQLLLPVGRWKLTTITGDDTLVLMAAREPDKSGTVTQTPCKGD